jgi:tetratricopeptide (TPR) repeat protein
MAANREQEGGIDVISGGGSLGASDVTRDSRVAGSGAVDDSRGSADMARLPTFEMTLGALTVTSDGAVPARRNSDDGVLPDSIDGYEILGEIHRGGQGVVYQAFQKSTKRTVAIKVLHGGVLADARARSRIEREVQLLGQIKHPNVVQVYDSGVAGGCIYYTMDYIAGMSLDRYLHKVKPSIQAGLRLFAQLCDAVNAAHLRGVIHRDIKPGNVLIDGRGEPYLVDFGLAKLAAEAGVSDSESGMLTLTGQFLGSAPWASPEQAEGVPERIDVRTDVYSLGVILYQMLTGKFPYEVTGKLPEVLERIRFSEPARPSTVSRRIGGELDTIVLKCLSKAPERRYQSAGEVARDIRHYLSGEPIEARRDSLLYVIRKNLKRYRVTVAVAAAFLLLLAGSAVTMTILWGQVRQEARKAALVANFLDGVLLSVDPDQAQASLGTPLYAAQLETVENAAAQAAALAAEPEVEARVRHTIGRLFMNLGRYGPAREQLETAARLRRATFGDQSAETAASEHELAWSLKELGEFDQAQSLYEKALGVRRALEPAGSSDVADTLNNLGQLYYARQKFDPAEKFLRESLDMKRRLGAPEKDLAVGEANLGSVLRDAKQLDEAERLLRAALETRQRVFGESHYQTVVSMNKLGLLLRERGRSTEARELLARTLELRRRVLPDDHPHVAVSIANLGMALADEGNYVDAAAQLDEALRRFWRDPKANLFRIQRALTELVEALTLSGQPAKAESRLMEAIAQCPSGERAGLELSIRAQLMLADLRLKTDPSGADAEVESSLRELREQASAALGPENGVTGQAESVLGTCLLKRGQIAEAEPLLLAGYRKALVAGGAAARAATAAAQPLVELYERTGDAAEAEKYRAAAKSRRQR